MYIIFPTGQQYPFFHPLSGPLSGTPVNSGVWSSLPSSARTVSGMGAGEWRRSLAPVPLRVQGPRPSPSRQSAPPRDDRTRRQVRPRRHRNVARLLCKSQVMIHIAQRSEQTHERTVQTGRASASGDEILLPEQIGCGNHRGAHRFIFVRPLRPDAIAVNPQCKSH